MDAYSLQCFINSCCGILVVLALWCSLVIFAWVAGEQLRLVVTPDDYLDKLVEYCIMKIYVVITVPDTKQTWAEEDDFQVTKPKLEIKVSTHRHQNIIKINTNVTPSKQKVKILN